jgi:CheY-like chemotaxis protein
MPATLAILALEDDPIIRSLLEAFFQIPGYRIVCAATGKAALECLRSDTFDVMLTDLMMPGYNGWEMIAMVHHLYPALPIILVSGSLLSTGTNGAAKARALGASGVLAKPFTRDELFAAIGRAVGPSESAGVSA